MLQNISNMAYTTITNFLSGRTKSLKDTWVHALNKPIPRKKSTYTMKNIITGNLEQFSSKLKFYTENNLSNRKKFGEFLCAENINKVYQGWQLTSISF